MAEPLPGQERCVSCQHPAHSYQVVAACGERTIDMHWICWRCLVRGLRRQISEATAKRNEAVRKEQYAWDRALTTLLQRTVTQHSPADAREPLAQCRVRDEQERGREQVRDEAVSLLRGSETRDYWRGYRSPEVKP